MLSPHLAVQCRRTKVRRVRDDPGRVGRGVCPKSKGAAALLEGGTSEAIIHSVMGIRGPVVHQRVGQWFDSRELVGDMDARNAQSRLDQVSEDGGIQTVPGNLGKGLAPHPH